MNIGTEKTNIRPDLPELESVEARTPVFIVLIVLLLTSPLTYMTYWTYSNSDKLLSADLQLRLILGVAIAIFLLLSLWILYRFLFDHYYWKTDSNGLTVRSVVRRRFIPWSDVIQTTNTCSVLYLSSGRLTIRKMHNRAQNLIICSIWQHLRRLGKVTDADLPEYADSFWDRIPDQLPREMEWINPKPARIVLNVIVSIAVIVSISVGFFFIPGYKDNEAWFMVIFAAISVGFICGLFILQQLITARRFHLNGGHFEAVKAYDTINASFSEITRAVFEIQNTTLCINKKKVRVPYNSSDENLQKLRLALIRVLREHGHLETTTISDDLRKSRIATIIPIKEPVELKLSRFKMFFWPSMCWLYALLFLLSLTSPNNNPAVSVGAAIGLVLLSIPIFLATRSFRLVIDSEGIARHCLNSHEVIKWTGVAEYIIVPRVSYSPKRLLKNSQGKVLMEISPWVEGEEEKRFFKHLDSILADKIIGYEDKRDWLAQPWEPGS